MTLFYSLLPPKSILCAGEDAFAHLFVLQRRLSFTVLCFLAQRIRLAFAFLSVGEDASFMIISFSSLLTPCSVFVWLSPSCVLEKTCLFISSRLKRAGGWGGGRSSPPPPICNEGAPSKRAAKAFSQGISFCVLAKILLFLNKVIVIAIVIVRKQSVKAEQRRSREAQKLKSKRKAKEEESNQQEKTTSNQSREEQQAKS